MEQRSINYYQYYILIGVISAIAVLFFPFVGTEVGLAFILPTTFAGWVVYIVSKLMVAAINILIFHCFVQQAKVVVADNPNYKKARELLHQVREKEEPVFVSPRKHYISLYGTKGVTIAVTSILGAVSLTQAILTFDVITFLTYLITIIFGVVFGIITQKGEEVYWTEDFYYYAKHEHDKWRENAEKINNMEATNATTNS